PRAVRLEGAPLDIEPQVLRMGDIGILEGLAVVGQHLAVVEGAGDGHPAIPLGHLLERAAFFLVGLGLLGFLGRRAAREQPLEPSLLAIALFLGLPLDFLLRLALLLPPATHHATHAAAHAAHPGAAGLLGVAVALLLLLLIIPFLGLDAVAFVIQREDK